MFSAKPNENFSRKSLFSLNFLYFIIDNNHELFRGSNSSNNFNIFASNVEGFKKDQEFQNLLDKKLFESLDKNKEPNEYEYAQGNFILNMNRNMMIIITI